MVKVSIRIIVVLWYTNITEMTTDNTQIDRKLLGLQLHGIQFLMNAC